MLNYKCTWHGKNLIKIGRFEPSSKLCNNCGVVNKDLKLSDRTWTCLSCNETHDRDINAATNILNFALQKQNLISPMGNRVEDMESLAIA
jgi:putative transposase